MPFKNKKILLLHPWHVYGAGLILQPNGEIMTANGSLLEFGFDYLLAEGDGDANLKIYDNDDILSYEIQYND